jgi:hypothetical protein
MADSLIQEWIALGIVAAAAGSVGVSAWRHLLAEPLSRWMLKRGRVTAAMKLRAQAERAVGACGGSCGSGKHCG